MPNELNVNAKIIYPNIIIISTKTVTQNYRAITKLFLQLRTLISTYIKSLKHYGYHLFEV